MLPNKTPRSHYPVCVNMCVYACVLGERGGGDYKVHGELGERV